MSASCIAYSNTSGRVISLAHSPATAGITTDVSEAREPPTVLALPLHFCASLPNCRANGALSLRAAIVVGLFVSAPACTFEVRTERPALGQDNSDGQPDGNDRSERDGDFAVAGVISGVVTSAALERGYIAIRTGQERHRVRATPLQLHSLNVGEHVTVRHVSIGSELWLIDNLDDRPDSQFGFEAKLTGNIVSLDKAEGILRLAAGSEGDFTLFAHPLALDGLLPGQLITADVFEVGTTLWVREVQAPPDGER